MRIYQSLKSKLFPPRDKEFSDKLKTLMLPMIFQQLMTSVVFIFDTIIVAGLGDEFLGGSGQANLLTGLMWSGLYAISSAGAIYAAQYWGKNKDLTGVRKAFTTTVVFASFIGIPCFIIGFFFSGPLMSVLAKDQATRDAGSIYLSIMSFSFLFWMVSAMLSSILRATGNTRIPTIASAVSIGINVLMDAVIVYGFLGFPRWGIRGAALSTVIGSAVDLFLLIILSRRAKLPITFSKRDFIWPEPKLLKEFIRAAIPLLSKDQLWHLGNVVYSISFASLGRAATAAYNAYGTLSEILHITFVAVGGAGGIMIGHMLGAGEIEKAKDYSSRILRLVILSGIAMFPVFLVLRRVFMLPFPMLSDQAVIYTMQALLLISTVVWARGINFTNMNGILRAGGDTLGAAAIDVGMLWGFGVPLILIVTFWLKLPFWAIFSVICIEEVLKVFISMARVRTHKWAKKLV